MDKDTVAKLSSKQLRAQIKEYDEQIFGENACSGVRDMMYLDLLQAEADRRGLTVKISPDDYDD